MQSIRSFGRRAVALGADTSHNAAVVISSSVPQTLQIWFCIWVFQYYGILSEAFDTGDGIIEAYRQDPPQKTLTKLSMRTKQ